jgi:flagellar biosynthesis/type III secretory pathway protein FliH
LKDWLTFFWFADKKSEEEMKVLLQNAVPHVQLAYDKYLQFSQDEELRQIEAARQQYLHDYATDLEYARREGIEKGREEGEVVGFEKGIEKGIKKGIETLLRILAKRFGESPSAVIEKLHTIKDLDRLAQLTDMSLDCLSLDEFEKALE